jgi:hypothetical protein
LGRSGERVQSTETRLEQEVDAIAPRPTVNFFQNSFAWLVCNVRIEAHDGVAVVLFELFIIRSALFLDGNSDWKFLLCVVISCPLCLPEILS